MHYLLKLENRFPKKSIFLSILKKLSSCWIHVISGITKRTLLAISLFYPI
uniref:Uncharacterized protein n=1 Tax=Neorickettsia sp. SF agent TaxID=172996 RepID=G0Z887_9RICK|nr:hypothetical protein [Neorickettsia sp. SF agent]